jgi:hypothetical protein
VKANYLRDAIAQRLSNQAIADSTTSAIGCSVKGG